MPDFDRIARTSNYIAGISFVNLTFIFAFLEEDDEVHKTRASVLLVVLLTLCNWITAILPRAYKFKECLTSQYSTGIVMWHVFCIFYGIIAMSLMALPALQTIQCCVVSFDDVEGFTKKIDFNCPLFSCDYMNMFIIIPFMSIVWSTFSVHYQIHNIFRYLHDRQQEAESYDRLVRRLTAAHRDGGAIGGGGDVAMNLDFDLDGIILANETRL